MFNIDIPSDMYSLLPYVIYSSNTEMPFDNVAMEYHYSRKMARAPQQYVANFIYNYIVNNDDTYNRSIASMLEFKPASYRTLSNIMHLLKMDYDITVLSESSVSEFRKYILGALVNSTPSELWDLYARGRIYNGDKLDNMYFTDDEMNALRHTIIANTKDIIINDDGVSRNCVNDDNNIRPLVALGWAVSENNIRGFDNTNDPVVADMEEIISKYALLSYTKSLYGIGNRKRNSIGSKHRFPLGEPAIERNETYRALYIMNVLTELPDDELEGLSRNLRTGLNNYINNA